jgi:hypothetical protein
MFVTNSAHLDKLVGMAPTLDNHHSLFLTGKYRDLRDGGTYHIFDDCPVGHRIPAQFVHPGQMPNGRLCRTCALRRRTAAA